LCNSFASLAGLVFSCFILLMIAPLYATRATPCKPTTTANAAGQLHMGNRLRYYMGGFNAAIGQLVELHAIKCCPPSLAELPLQTNIMGV